MVSAVSSRGSRPRSPTSAANASASPTTAERADPRGAEAVPLKQPVLIDEPVAQLPAVHRRRRARRGAAPAPAAGTGRPAPAAAASRATAPTSDPSTSRRSARSAPACSRSAANSSERRQQPGQADDGALAAQAGVAAQERADRQQHATAGRTPWRARVGRSSRDGRADGSIPRSAAGQISGFGASSRTEAQSGASHWLDGQMIRSSRRPGQRTGAAAGLQHGDGSRIARRSAPRPCRAAARGAPSRRRRPPDRVCSRFGAATTPPRAPGRPGPPAAAAQALSRPESSDPARATAARRTPGRSPAWPASPARRRRAPSPRRPAAAPRRGRAARPGW